MLDWHYILLLAPFDNSTACFHIFPLGNMWGIKSFWVCLLALANVFLSCRGSDDVDKKLTELIHLNGGDFLMGSSYVGGERDEVAPDGSTPLKVKHVDIVKTVSLLLPK